MQPHIIKAYSFLEEYLPEQYTKPTQRILKTAKIKVSDEVIRNVRTKKTTSNITVLNALLRVAKKNKRAQENLAASIEN